MFGFFSFVWRLWTIASPPRPPKTRDAVRVGLLGASKIAPMAVINPARSHPEVLVAAVAARNVTTAEQYAKKYDIPIVHQSYQDLLDDPSIDAVYIPLPNGLHYEWAIKALKAGKHILLEKPSTSNAEEAEILFKHPLLQQATAPVLLEAFHYRFHPAWQVFLTLLDQKSVATASAIQYLPKGIAPLDDIRFQFGLAGGALMDFGTYTVNFIRQIFGTEPSTCLEASYRPMPPTYNEPQIEQSITAKWRFPNGGVGDIHADLSATGGWPAAWLTSRLPKFRLPIIVVSHAETEVKDRRPSKPNEKHTVQRKVTMWNALMPTIYHRIDVEESHVVRNQADGSVVRKWTEDQQVKAYAADGSGEAWWTTYRYQLEEFVNRIKGRPGSGVWVEASDSIKQMKMIDSAYERAGLQLRPTSSYE